MLMERKTQPTNQPSKNDHTNFRKIHTTEGLIKIS